MSHKLSRDSFADLIEGNLAWLLKHARTLERDHIAEILRDAGRVYYDLEPRAVAAETALAAAQAQVKELREALQLALEPMPYDPDTAQWSEPGDEELRAKYNAEWKRRAELLRAALAAPSDTTALRALLLKVAQAVVTSCPMTNNREVHGNLPAIVDAVLAKEGM